MVFSALTALELLYSTTSAILKVEPYVFGHVYSAVKITPILLVYALPPTKIKT